MKLSLPERPSGEVWGALAAMLVALPSAIAFGVTVFAPFGDAYAAQGAIAGILGTTALGLVAPLFGGTNRLITAPCAPAAAVLAALAIELSGDGIPAQTAVLLLALVSLGCGALQIGLGAAGVGRLIKYMPYPVVSGYLSGVGLVIIVSQVPKLFGAPSQLSIAQVLSAPSTWSWQSISVGAATIVVMVAARRHITAVPAAILGLAAGVAAYFVLALSGVVPFEVTRNSMVVGPLMVGEGGLFDAVTSYWSGFRALELDHLRRVVTPALTLAVLLSIDTLKTCVVLDALTHSRHDSNRELLGQGIANLASTAIGGLPGAGQMGATLVNMSSGGRTRLSSVLEGLFSLIAFLALASVIAWVPIAALAGILIVIGISMIDWRSLELARSRQTVLDFIVVVTVVIVAKTVSLIAASGIGVGLAILLYVREQIRSTVVARKALGSQMFSKQARLEPERQVLLAHGGKTAIFELQGSLFFGTADQLYQALEPELRRATYVIVDLRRVQSVDVTAAHMLEQAQGLLAERDGCLIFSALPRRLPSGRDMQRYFGEMGLVRPEQSARVFDELDDALDWVEGRVLAAEGSTREQEIPLELQEIDMLVGRKQQTIEDLRAAIETRSLEAGEKVFESGDTGDELYLIRRGTIRIELSMGHESTHHLATFGRGDFFGEMAFLDHAPRSADAIASSDTDLFVISRERFDRFAADHKRVGMTLFQGLARSLAVRMRNADAELRALQES